MKQPTQLFKPALCSLIGIGTGFSAVAEISIIKNSGDIFGTEIPLTTEGFSVPAMNDFGEITFAVNFDEYENGDSTRFEGICLYDGSSTHLLASVDTIAPKPGDDGVFEYFYKPDISELGIAFFRGKMQGSQWARNTNGTWLGWTVTQNGEARPKLDMLNRIWDRASINYDGERAEEGGNYTHIGHPNIVQPRSFAFIAELDDGEYEDRSGVWYQGATASGEWEIPRPDLIALQGEPLPGHTTPLGIIQSFTTIDETAGILLAKLEHSEDISANNDLALYLTRMGDNATLITQTGDTESTSGETFASLSAPIFNEDGTITFWASLNNANQDEGLYSYHDGSLSEELSTRNSIETDTGSISIKSLFDPQTNANGDICVLATLEDNHQAILHRTSGSNWQIITQTGDQSPGTEWGAFFKNFSSPQINPKGQIAFLANLEGQGDSISDTTDSGIWATDTNGNIVLVAQEGDLIHAGEGKLRNLASYSIGSFTETGSLALLLKFTNHGSAIATAQVNEATPPTIIEQPEASSEFNGEKVEFTISVDGQGPFNYQWSKDGTLIEGATSSSLVIANADQGDEGGYTVTVTSSLGSITSNVADLSLQEWPDLPVFSEEPLGDIALVGGEALLTARALSNQEITYQWYKDGNAIDGATSSTLSIDEVIEEDEGSYYVTATSDAGSTQSTSAEILVTERRLINISTRARVGTGANVLIAGFAVEGNKPKQVLIRGIGPALSQFNVEGLLEKPEILLIRGSEILTQNSGWDDGDNSAAIADAANIVGAFPLPTDSEDAAILTTLEPGSYTAMLVGENQTTGIALVEVYEVERNAERLINISSRAHVGAGQDLVIPGVVIEGDVPAKVLARAVGPSLDQFNLPGLLQNPILEIIDSTGNIVASNSRWQDVNDINTLESAMETAGAFALNDESDDAALIAELAPGAYTIFVRGEDNTTGLALVEVYSIP